MFMGNQEQSADPIRGWRSPPRTRTEWPCAEQGRRQGQPPPAPMPCQPPPAPMPCCTCGGGLFEAPPLLLPLLGAGGGATGSLAGWTAAGVRLFVVGARANEGSLTAATGVALFFSGLFVFRLFFGFRLFPCAPPTATGGTAGAADAAWGDCWDGPPPSVPENRPPRITTTGTRTAIARPPQSQLPPRELHELRAPLPLAVAGAIGRRGGSFPRCTFDAAAMREAAPRFATITESQSTPAAALARPILAPPSSTTTIESPSAATIATARLAPARRGIRAPSPLAVARASDRRSVPVPGSILSAAASRSNVSVLGG